MTLVNVRDKRDVEAVIQEAVIGGKALEVVGRGTKRAIGCPVKAELTLDLSGLSNAVDYAPEELVLSLGAGMPLSEVRRLLDGHAQELPFEPMDISVLFGGGDEGTIGGAIATGFSGPRRIKVGAARDHVLGMEAVSGRGELFKAGGRVVKNVTGYDLAKLMAGSWGTLAVVTEFTLKVLPKPETEVTLLLRGLDWAQASTAMAEALKSPFDVSSAAHLPAQTAARLDGGEGAALTALRIEGIAVSVAHRAKALSALLAPFGAVDHQTAESSHRLWRAVRDVMPFAASGPMGRKAVWRIIGTPTAGPGLAAELVVGCNAEVFLDWGGGLIWAAVDADGDAGASAIRRLTSAFGAHASLIRAPEAVRRAIEVFAQPERAIMALNRRVKASFDPLGLLNPGRMMRETTP